MDELFFSERRKTTGAVIVTLHYPGAYVDQETIPPKFRKLFKENVIGFYVFYQNMEPRTDRCFKIAQGYLAKEYRDAYIIDQFFLDALYRVASLSEERSPDCMAISLTDYRHPTLSNLWRNFKSRHRGSALVRFWSTRILTAEELAEIGKEKDEWLRIMSYPSKDRFDYAQLKIPQSQIGISLDEFYRELTFVDESIDRDPIQDVADPAGRIEKAHGGPRKDRIADFDSEISFLKNISARNFDVFNFDELAKIYFSIYAYAPVSYLFEGNSRSSRDFYPVAEPDYDLVAKLKISLYQNSKFEEDMQNDKDWNTLVAAFRAIPEFDFGPDFDIRIDWTRGFSQIGWAKYTRLYHTKGKWTDFSSSLERSYDKIYLDNQLGYIILKNGKPVLIIGFAISDNKKLLVSQIQLVKPKGNRWLFKLPYHYFDYALLKMQEAFPDFELYFVEGSSLAGKIKSSYGVESPMKPETYDYIERTYNRPLELFERGEKTYIGKYYYFKLN